MLPSLHVIYIVPLPMLSGILYGKYDGNEKMSLILLLQL